MQQQQAGKLMRPEVLAALGEFYLAVALRLRPEAIDAAGVDATGLLRIARDCAEEDFEPFIEEARALVANYDPSLHAALEETCPLYEVDEGLFWRANFDVAAPAEFHHYLTALGHGSGASLVPAQAHTSKAGASAAVEQAWQGLVGDDARYG